jgi:amino acid transporter
MSATTPPTSSEPSSSVDINYLNTIELLPGADNYLYDASGSVAARPGMKTMSKGGLPAKALADRAKLVASVKEDRRKAAINKKFGTCDGVIVRCLLNIWGVIMFLRMGFVVAHAGILEGSLVVLASLLLTVLTATSLSAIATNGEVEGGGAYFLISRSLGAESGGAIGLVFAVANAVSVSMYLIGFSETVVGLYGPGTATVSSNPNVTAAVVDNYMTNKAWDIRIVAFIGLFVILCVACAGADWVVKIDIGQLCILIIGILAFVIGSFTTPVNADPTTGMAFTGWNETTFASNWGSDYRPTVINPQGENFMTIFSVFFPAVTGMMAGANISGELKNAQKSLPFGTMFAVTLSNVVYVAIAWILGATCLRDGGLYGGLFGDSILMIRMAVWGPLVIVGIFASTISSALATLVGAPRILKAVCDDGLFPPLEWFAVAREKDNEPIRGYFLTGFIAILGILIGDLNAIAPLITNFFLATRALINFACFLASYSRSPGWRPTYKMYNKWVSLVTAVLCIAVMFAISWWQALVTLGLGFALYVYIRRAAPEVNWGAAELGYKWSTAKKSLLHLDKIELSHHVKTWRPIFLGIPFNYASDIQTVVNYSKQLEHANGFTIVGDILIGEFHQMYKKSQERIRARYKFTKAKKEHKSTKKEGEKQKSGNVDHRQEKIDGMKKINQDLEVGTIELSMRKENAHGSATGNQEGGEGGGGGGGGGGEQDTSGASLAAASNASTTNETQGEAATGTTNNNDTGKKVRFGNGTEVSPSLRRRVSAEAIFSNGKSKTDETKEIAGDEDAEGNQKVGQEEEEQDERIQLKRFDSMAVISKGVDSTEGVLTETLISSSRLEGVRTMIQTSGVGRMKPNMLLLPTIPQLKHEDAAQLRDDDYTDDMVDMLLSALRFDYGVGLLSASRSNWGEEFIKPNGATMMGCFGSRHRYGDTPTLQGGSVSMEDAPTIDVYWVSDTGGCLLLIAYMHSQWARWKVPCQLVSVFFFVVLF